MSFLKKVNSKVTSINNYFNKYLESSEFEKNLKEALNNKNYGMANSVLHDLSISTYDANYYKRLVDEVFKAIQEKPSKWRRIYKGLRLCEFVMKNGCDYFVTEVKQKEEIINKLTHFAFLEDLRDRGVAIREISSNILKLLKDNAYLEIERQKAIYSLRIYPHIESKANITKKGFFARRKEKQKDSKHSNIEPYIKDKLKSQKDIALKSLHTFDQLLKERNIIYEQKNQFNDYQHSRDSKRNTFSGKLFSESSSQYNSSVTYSETKQKRSRSKDKYKRKKRENKALERKENSNMLARISRSSSRSFSDYSCDIPSATSIRSHSSYVSSKRKYSHCRDSDDSSKALSSASSHPHSFRRSQNDSSSESKSSYRPSATSKSSVSKSSSSSRSSVSKSSSSKSSSSRSSVSKSSSKSYFSKSSLSSSKSSVTKSSDSKSSASKSSASNSSAHSSTTSFSKKTVSLLSPRTPYDRKRRY